MKNKSIIALSLCSIFAYTQDFVVIVDEHAFEVKDTYEVIEEAGAWTNIRTPYNCASVPMDSDYYKGVDFSQDTTCEQDQEREIKVYHQSYETGNKVLVETKTEEQTILETTTSQSTGTYLAATCKEIVDYHGKDGDKVYETSNGNVFCDMDYRDGSGYKRTHLYNPDRMFFGNCTQWISTRAEWCSNNSDIVYFTLNKDNYAFMEYVTYNYANTPHNSATSIITVDGIDKAYNLLSPTLHSINLSGRPNGSNKQMVIRFTHDGTSPGDNNMGVREIYLYEQ